MLAMLFIKNSSKPPLLLNMVPSLYQKMLLVATVALFVMSMADEYEARRILHGQAPTISASNPPITGDLNHTPLSTFKPKAFAGDHNNASSSLGRMQYPPHVLVPPSAPNPGTYNPSSSWRQRKNPPHPYMLHGSYYQGTHIPASTTSTTAPMLGTP